MRSPMASRGYGLLGIIGPPVERGRHNRIHCIVLLVTVGGPSLFVSTVVSSLSLDATRLAGIWKLTTNSLPYEQDDIRSKHLKSLQLSSLEDDKKQNETTVDDGSSSIDTGDVIYLKLNGDGTFRQYNEGYREGRWMSGNWKLFTDTTHIGDGEQQKHRNRIVLAMNRQYYGPQFDVALDGWIDVGNNQDDDRPDTAPLVVEGNVNKGRFVHPRKHPSFFDPPFLANVGTLGPFILERSLAFHSAVGPQEKDDSLFGGSDYTDVRTSDFHGRRFIMTVEPLEQSKKLASQREQKQQHELDSRFLDRPVDIRSMPVQFFANNTFAAVGVNKILRGRFQIVHNHHQDDSTVDGSPLLNHLSMTVSIFGAGRSAPGSVYSEGLGLTHDDERTYIGEIQPHWELHAGGESLGQSHQPRRQLLILGTVFYGTDLGEDARPEPVARFVLVEDSSTSRRQTLLDSSPENGKKDTIQSNHATKGDDNDNDASSFNGGVFQ